MSLTEKLKALEPDSKWIDLNFSHITDTPDDLDEEIKNMEANAGKDGG